MTKTYIALNIVSTMIFQFCLIYFTDISLSTNPGLWSVITIAYALFLPFWTHPLDDRIQGQITLHKERQARCRKYEQFQADIKSGLIAAEDFEAEARRVVE